MIRHLFVVRKAVVLLITISVFLFAITSCSKRKVEAEPSVIGDISYNSSLYIMSLEAVEGEEEKGIVYREVLDFNKFITAQDRTTVIYFYTSANTDVYGITAGVEDMAQYYGDEITFLCVDSVEHRDITTAYEINALPEFVLVENNMLISYFEGYKYDYWEIKDVMNWIEENK